MKFILKSSSQSGRRGSISALGRLPGLEFETPMLLMHTRGGNIPHITRDVLQMVTTEPLFMQMPLSTLLHTVDRVSEFDCGVSAFVGLKEYPAYMTPQDPAVLSPPGYNFGDSVAVWGRRGKTDVTPSKYMAMIEKLRPDMFLTLSDGDTHLTSSSKRIDKSKNRSSRMFKDCLAYYQTSKVLKNSAILGSIQGGNDVKARQLIIEEMTIQPVIGFVIDGLHNNGPSVEDISFKSISHVVSECVRYLPQEKLRIVHGPWNPVTLLHLVAAGVDAFDASLPYLSTERDAALSFSYQERPPQNSIGDPSIEINSKFEEGIQQYEIYLNDSRYAEDFTTLLKDCQCLTCRRHTRAYLHHLIRTKELLGRVLLMIHNVYHYLEYFKAIRKAVETNTLSLLVNMVSNARNK